MQVAPSSTIIRTVVPPNVTPGTFVQVTGPNGQIIQVQVPQNVNPGETFDTHVVMQVQQHPYYHQPYHHQQPTYNNMHRQRTCPTRCCYNITMFTSILFATVTFFCCLPPVFDDEIAKIEVYCGLVEKNGVSLCSSDSYYYEGEEDKEHEWCGQERLNVGDTWLNWTTVGIENVGNLSWGNEKKYEEEEHNHDHDKEGGDHYGKHGKRIKLKHIDYVSVWLDGSGDHGGFNDLRATEKFKQSSLMNIFLDPKGKNDSHSTKPDKTIGLTKKSKDQNIKNDIVLKSRQGRGGLRAFSVILCLITMGLYALRIMSFCCRTAFERRMKRNTHFQTLGWTHIGLWFLYLVLLIMHGGLPLLADNSSNLVKMYPYRLECKADAHNPQGGWHIVELLFHFYAGAVLLLNYCCCFYNDDALMMAHAQQTNIQTAQPHHASFHGGGGGAMVVQAQQQPTIVEQAQIVSVGGAPIQLPQHASAAGGVDYNIQKGGGGGMI